MTSLSVLLFNSIKTRNKELSIKYMDELLQKDNNREYLMKLCQDFGEQDLEFAKILNGDKNGLYHDIVRIICSKTLAK